MAAAAAAQQKPLPTPVADPPNLMRTEGVDAESGIHYVRLTVLLAPAATRSSAPAHFTMECTELNGKRDLSWFVTFGGVQLPGFTSPFRRTPQRPKPPKNPSRKLEMDFEGYMKWKPLTGVWEVLPSGELRYRNPGMHSPNMASPRAFLAYLNSLPALHIGYADAQAGDPAEEVFQLRPLLDEVATTSVCRR
jgi:hypothetical protein